MPRIFITGSSDGLGLLAARRLVAQGHSVTLHARNAERAASTWRALPEAAAVLIGDFSTLAGMNAVADQATEAFDAVIHNAGVYLSPKRIVTTDGLQQTFAVNVLAPYLLTARMKRPRRLIYMSSGMHRSGDPGLDDPQWERRPWNASQAYSDSKLYDVMLAFAVARLWQETIATAVDPGWVPTKMGGPGAPDDLDLGSLTQAWLAVSDDAAARRSGTYFHHQKPHRAHPAATDVAHQRALLDYCAGICGVTFPRRD